MIQILISVSLLFGLSAFAAERQPDPQFGALFVRQTNQCRYADSDFQLISAGLTRELDPEEEHFGARTLWIKKGNEAPVLAIRDDRLEFGEFLVRRVGNSDNSICYGVASFALSPSIVALTFIRDQRPGGEGLGAIFYDVKSNQVLKAIPSMGTIDEQKYEPLMSAERMKVWRVSSSSPSFYFFVRENRSEAYRGEVAIRGVKSPFMDRDLGIVKRVSWESQGQGKGAPLIETDPDATYARSEWTRFFPNKEEFKKLAGWDASQKRFAHEVIWVAAPTDSAPARCVQFAKSKKDLKLDAWRCTKAD